MIVRLPAIALLTISMLSWAKADDVDKSGYTLFDPTPDDLMRKFAPDRPTKGFSVRTIDAGHFEIETDLVNYTYSNSSGVTARNYQALDPTFKLGLTNWMDFEVQFNGLQYTESFDRTSPFNFQNVAGFGDPQRLWRRLGSDPSAPAPRTDLSEACDPVCEAQAGEEGPRHRRVGADFRIGMELEPHHQIPSIFHD